jgi:hypothetical protein
LEQIAITQTTSYELSAFAGDAVRVRVTQHEHVRVPDGGGMGEHDRVLSTGQWLVKPGRVYPEGQQRMKGAIPSQISGELITELRVAER